MDPLHAGTEPELTVPTALDPAVLTPCEVGAILRVSDVTVRRLVSRGILPRIPGVRVILIPRVAVLRLLGECQDEVRNGPS